MPRNDPKFVRLPAEGDVLPVGIYADVQGGSGWSISGLDVQEVPAKDDPAYKFVKSGLNSGRLEEATQAEFDAVQKHNADLAKLHPVKVPEGETPPPWNEPAIAATAKRARAKLVSQRNGNGTDDDGDDDDPYSSMSKEELQAHAASQGLDTSGTKSEIKARLQEASAGS